MKNPFSLVKRKIREFLLLDRVKNILSLLKFREILYFAPVLFFALIAVSLVFAPHLLVDIFAGVAIFLAVGSFFVVRKVLRIKNQFLDLSKKIDARLIIKGVGAGQLDLQEEDFFDFEDLLVDTKKTTIH